MRRGVEIRRRNYAYLGEEDRQLPSQSQPPYLAYLGPISTTPSETTSKAQAIFGFRSGDGSHGEIGLLLIGPSTEPIPCNAPVARSPPQNAPPGVPAVRFAVSWHGDCRRKRPWTGPGRTGQSEPSAHEPIRSRDAARPPAGGDRFRGTRVSSVSSSSTSSTSPPKGSWT